MDYENGNSYLGTTIYNHNKWSLNNEDWPAKALTEDPAQDSNIMPILRKYPNFMEKGMGLCVAPDDGSTTDETLVPLLDYENSSFKLDAGGNQANRNWVFGDGVFEEITTTDFSRLNLGYQFVEAQVNDGLIDPLAYDDAPGSSWNWQLPFVNSATGNKIASGVERPYFAAFAHSVCYTSQQAGNDLPYTNGYEGSDFAWRNRPRGVITMIDKTTYDAKTTELYPITAIGVYPETGYGFHKGIWLQYGKTDVNTFNYIKLGYLCYAWVRSNSCSAGIDTGDYGFQDYNCLNGTAELNSAAGAGNILISGSFKDVVDNSLAGVFTQVIFGFGYSYMKTGWRNFTSMLTSYDMNDQDATDFMFDPTKSRQSTSYFANYSGKQDASENIAGIRYTDRVFIGARRPTLTFDTDGSSRFYWAQFYTPEVQANEYNQGIDNSTNYDQLRMSTQLPSQDYFRETAPDWFDTQDIAGNDYLVYANALNANAGTDAIQYNQEKWNRYNDGLFQLAPEMMKHDLIQAWSGQAATAVPVDGYWLSQSVCGQHWPQNYAMMEDFYSRFFCYDQDVRRNTQWCGTQVYNQGDQTDFDVNNATSAKPMQYYEWEDDSGTQTQLNIVQGAPTNSFFWGSLAGEQGFITVKSEAGGMRPNPSVIYAETMGAAVYNWGNYNKTNWDSSVWKTLGFEYSDVAVDRYIYCNQQRNFTTNFLSNQITSSRIGLYDTKFITQSYPMTTSTDLISTGFLSITSNMVGAKNYTINYPRSSILSSVGTMGVTAKAQKLELINNIFTNVAATIVGTPINGTWPTNTDSLGDEGLTFNKPVPINGGASFENGALVRNPFWISATTDGLFGTPVYASNVASKLSSPFYLIRSTFPQDSFKYINNATPSTIMPIVGIINLQYGATTDFYWSQDVSTLTFTAKSNMEITDIPILITDNMGQPATTLEGKSTIFFKITRNPEIPDLVDGELQQDLQRLENSLDKDKSNMLRKEMEQLVNADVN